LLKPPKSANPPKLFITYEGGIPVAKRDVCFPPRPTLRMGVPKKLVDSEGKSGIGEALLSICCG
jgi:hypothetical protein